MNNEMTFEAPCPWCKAINLRKTFYWTFSCFYCKALFYVNGLYKSCRVIKNSGSWKYVDEVKQSWMN